MSDLYEAAKRVAAQSAATQPIPRSFDADATVARLKRRIVELEAQAERLTGDAAQEFRTVALTLAEVVRAMEGDG